MVVPKHSIFSSLLLSFVLINVLIIIAGSFFYYQYAVKRDVQAVENDLTTVLKNNVALLNTGYLNTITNTLKLMEFSPSLLKIRTLPEKEARLIRFDIERQFSEIIRANKGLYKSIRFVNIEGTEQAIVQGRKRIRRFKSLLPGQNNSSNDQALIDIYQVLQTLSPGVVYFSENDQQTDDINLYAGVVLSEPDIGGFGGAVIAEVNLNEFQRQMSSVLYRGQSVSVIQIRSDINNPEFHSPVLEAIADAFQHDVYPGKALADSFFLRLIVVFPQRILDEQANQIVKTTLAVALVSLVLTIFLSYLLASRFVKPIEQLAEQSQRFSKGDFTPISNITGQAEINALIEALNLMADEVGEDMNRLNLISDISRALDTESGTSFYRTLIKALAETLKLDFAFIGRFSDKLHAVSTFAAYANGNFIDDYQCVLNDTPNATLAEQTAFVIPKQATQHFNADKLLAEMSMESYIGVRLDDSGGHPIGILYVLSQAAMEHPDYIANVVRIFATRAAFEIEREIATENLTHQAKHDALTSLINRNEFECQLRHHIDTAKRYDEKHTLCFLDLDQFKVVNDTAGHIAGDVLLQNVGTLLKEHLRDTDIVARLGGDEFGVLMLNTSTEQAVEKADDILRLIEDIVFTWDENTYRIGCSIGITKIDQATSSHTEMLKQADMACYAAKELGRNRSHIYTESDADLSQKKNEMQWSTRITEAINNNRLMLYAQEIRPTKTDQTFSHYEILIRMQDDNGDIPPNAFLPAAERYGLIGKIDYWVIDNVFRWLRQHAAKLHPQSYLSINLSGHSIGDDKTLEQVEKWITTERALANRIRFEITESMAITNLSQANHFIDTVKHYGCGVSLDDFGSGLSSFGYLKNLKADTLKIDGLFVRDIINDPIDKALVESINQVGHLLEMETVAEYVENDAIAEELVRIGVDYLQGYGIAKPVPIDDIC